ERKVSFAKRKISPAKDKVSLAKGETSFAERKIPFAKAEKPLDKCQKAFDKLNFATAFPEIAEANSRIFSTNNRLARYQYLGNDGSMKHAFYTVVVSMLAVIAHAGEGTNALWNFAKELKRAEKDAPPPIMLTATLKSLGRKNVLVFHLVNVSTKPLR